MLQSKSCPFGDDRLARLCAHSLGQCQSHCPRPRVPLRVPVVHLLLASYGVMTPGRSTGLPDTAQFPPCLGKHKMTGNEKVSAMFSVPKGLMKNDWQVRSGSGRSFRTPTLYIIYWLSVRMIQHQPKNRLWQFSAGEAIDRQNSPKNLTTVITSEQKQKTSSWLRGGKQRLLWKSTAWTAKWESIWFKDELNGLKTSNAKTN